MISISAKAHICRDNAQAHLQRFCKSKLQSIQKGQAATQMDRSGASSEISFHSLPSKSERPSIRKQIPLSLSSQLILLVFAKQPAAERYLPNIISPVSLRTFTKLQQCIKIHSENFQKVYKKAPVMKSYVSKDIGFYRSNHRIRSVKRVFAKFTGKGSCQIIYFNKVAFLRL